MYLEITKFNTTNLSGASGVTMIDMVDADEVVSRIYNLSNGAIFDADGSTDADIALGQVVATCRLVTATGGLATLNTAVTNFKGLEGKSAVLQGILRGASDTTYQCTARCIGVEPMKMEYTDVRGKAGSVVARITMTWQKKSQWAAV